MKRIPTPTTSGACPSFQAALESSGLAPLRREHIEVLQINVGWVCNQACTHCHVDAGLMRNEKMSAAVAAACIGLLEACPGIQTVDLTGGAPELNPRYRWLVSQARELERHVCTRTNLTALLLEGQEDLVDFYACHQVEVLASLPSVVEKSVEQQRGRGTFRQSIEALRRLNARGYGKKPELVLNLVHNPLGATLPPDQPTLHKTYQRELKSRYGIVFNQLITLTNMPIRRFERHLHSTNQYESYMQTLVEAFCPETVARLMCRTMLNVGHDGKLYDCDYNQMMNLPLMHEGCPMRIWDIAESDVLGKVQTAAHCFGCTAAAAPAG